jgi:hypothetical protein
MHVYVCVYICIFYQRNRDRLKTLDGGSARVNHEQRVFLIYSGENFSRWFSRATSLFDMLRGKGSTSATGTFIYMLILNTYMYICLHIRGFLCAFDTSILRDFSLFSNHMYFKIAHVWYINAG